MLLSNRYNFFEVLCELSEERGKQAMAVSVGEEIDELQRKISLLGKPKDKECLALFQL